MVLVRYFRLRWYDISPLVESRSHDHHVLPARTRPRVQGLLLLSVIAEYRERTNYRIPVHYCILEAAFFEERGISIHMQVSGRVFCNLAQRNIWMILLKFIYRRGDKIDL